ncbi:MAG: hypothetical protein CL906_01270 [Dehalococcoidia bacterium]|nr:hypothetical protein [Dehalococcoidia bacterium]
MKEIKNNLKKYNWIDTQELNETLNTLFEGLNESSLNEWGSIIYSSVENTDINSSQQQYVLSLIKESPNVFRSLPQTQFIEWAKQSNRIASENSDLGKIYVDSSTDILKNLRPRHLLDWGNLGLSLFKSSKNSSLLAKKFYKLSPEINIASSYDDLEKLVDTCKRISTRNVDYSSKTIDWVYKISQFSPNDLKMWNEIINKVSKILIKDFEKIFQLLAENADLINQRKEFMKSLIIILDSNPQDFFVVIKKSIEIFSDISLDYSEEYENMLISLTANKADQVKGYSLNFQTLRRGLSKEKFNIWFNNGISIINSGNNAEGYFSLDSPESKALFNELTFSVDLDIEKDILKLYCCALSGQELGVQSSNIMVDKEIGWFNSNLATTEGSTIYLPESIKKFPERDKNFSWLKVIATHQVGHVEFGTFKLKLDSASSKFKDLRFSLVKKLEENSLNNTTDITDMTKYFKLFENSKLAQDIFSVFEAFRVDEKVLNKYRGISNSYKDVKENALQSRPEVEKLPGRELLIELIIRYSLKPQKLKAPKKLESQLKELLNLLVILGEQDSGIEDTAEATLRAYKILMGVKNESQDDFEEYDFEEDIFEKFEDSYNDLLEFYSYSNENLSDSDINNSTENNNEEELDNYSSPQEVEHWGEFKPELSQLLLEMSLGEAEFSDEGDLSDLSAEQIEEMLKDSVDDNLDENADNAVESEITQNLEEALNEMQTEKIEDDQSKFADRFDHFDEDGKALEVVEDNQFLYDEWDFRDETYKKNWCLVNEKKIGEGDLQYYEETLEKYADIVADIKKQFELMNPETYRKIKRLEEGEEQDLDLTVEAMVDLRAGISPSEKLYWRRNKVERSISVAFLLDMSASTAEAIDDTDSSRDEWSAPDNPEKYMEWLRKRRSQGFRRSYKRIVDLEKEGLILLLDALENLGDTYGIFGFSGYGRENVEYFTIKDLDENFSPLIPKRIDRISPLHATRMGPAVRHCTQKLLKTEEKSKFIFLISDGRPQDRGYSREGVEKEYAVNDTKKALLEAKNQGITTFCLTVDKEGHDYMKSMMEDLSYEVLDDIASLPLRIPQLYRNLTST